MPPGKSRHCLIRGYLIFVARLLITPEMLELSAVKAATTAKVTKAAAIAYSESSNPLSSLANALITDLITVVTPFDEKGRHEGIGIRASRISRLQRFLLDLGREVADHAADVGAQRGEHTDDCESYQSRCYGIL
jgi:hypothetical protein